MNHINIKSLSLRSAMCASLLSASLTYAQTAQNNPLIRPNLKAAEATTQNLPPPPQAKTGNDSAPSPKSAQEEFALRNQQLNAERVPLPLRLLLAPVYVSAISGDTAILRQPLPLVQQASLAFQAFQGMGQNQQGVPVGMSPQANQFQGQTPMMGNIGTTQPSGLSNPAGMQPNAQIQPPNRPTTIRVTHNTVVNVLGFSLKAKVENNMVVLTLQDNPGNPVVVFQSGIESASSPQFIPAQNALEKPDNAYYERVQAKAASSGGVAAGSKPDTGAGARP